MSPLVTGLKPGQVIAAGKISLVIAKLQSIAHSAINYTLSQVGGVPLHSPFGLEPSPPQVKITPPLSP